MFLVMCEHNNGRVYPECLLHSTKEFAAWKLKRIQSKGRFEHIDSNTRTSLRFSYGEAWTLYTLEYIKPWSENDLHCDGERTGVQPPPQPG